MFGLFKRKDWQPDVIPLMTGAHDGLSVTVRNFPCLRDSATGSRTYRYPNFGSEFINGVAKELGDYQELRNVLDAKAGKTVVVVLPKLPAIEVSLMGSPSTSSRQLDSNLADAMIAAFESQGLKP
jgi:hypothetical protein